MPAEYVIYRKTSITDDESTVAQLALLNLGTAIGNNAQQALVNWYVENNETELGEYVVIPLSHIHELAPRLPQPRLVFE